MNKKLLSIAISLVLGTTLISCEVNENPQPQQPVQQEVMFHKTIDVKIMSVQNTWRTNREIDWNLKIRSDEYNLEKDFRIVSTNMSSTPYAYELFYGKVRENSIIKCELYSWKVGETITRRELGNLVQ